MQRYDLLLTGTTLPGHKTEAVVLALAKLLELSETQAQALLSGREWVVKQNLDGATLEKFQAALNSAGAATRVREVAQPPQALPVPGKTMDCPCCGRATLSRRGAGDRCRHCGWHDDRRQNEHCPGKVVAGINRGLSLSQAQAEFAHYGTLNTAGYTPNQMPLRTRLIHGFSALFIVAYCGYSLWRGSLYIPGLSKSGFGYASRKVDTNFQGIDAWLMAAALLSGALFLALSVIDHYDRRRNEHHYQRAGQVCFALMAVLMGIAFIAQTYREHGFLGAVPVGLVVIAIVGAVLIHLFRMDP